MQAERICLVLFTSAGAAGEKRGKLRKGKKKAKYLVLVLYVIYVWIRRERNQRELATGN
jgi:hypothetical protein